MAKECNYHWWKEDVMKKDFDHVVEKMKEKIEELEKVRQIDGLVDIF